MSDREEGVAYAARPRWPQVLPWVLAFGSPVLYLLDLSIRYALVEPACESASSRALLELVGALGVIGTAAPGWVAWLRLKGTDGGSTVGGRAERGEQLLLQLAVISAAIFVLVAIATWLPSWIVSP